MSQPERPKTAQFGDYTVTGKLGEGGMCVVYRARKKGELGDCALKLLREERRTDERVLDLFVTEADLSLLLHHPNLIETFDAGEIGGRYYIAMELVEGANLKEIVSQCERIGVELPPDFALFIVSEILEGLEAIHEAAGRSGAKLGLVHRDVTPHNVFVSFDGRVILGDLGIAHIQAYGETEMGVAVGKLGYLSPEQAVGEPIDGRSDLFAVGVILFELLTGKRLYEGASEQAVLADIAEGKAPKLRKLKPALARDLESLLGKALQRRAKDRFQTAEELVLALHPFWSPTLGNPKSLGGLMRGIFREEARAFDERRRRARAGSGHEAPRLVGTPLEPPPRVPSGASVSPPAEPAAPTEPPAAASALAAPAPSSAAASPTAASSAAAAPALAPVPLAAAPTAVPVAPTSSADPVPRVVMGQRIDEDPPG